MIYVQKYLCVLLFLVSIVWSTLSSAQSSEIETEAELLVQQESLAQQLFQDPANIELMFAHASVSIKLRDYESAITTLERLLIFERDLTRVRLELGVAYFNLGSYAVARLYLNQVLQDPALPDDSRELVASYLSAIDARTAENRLSVVVNVGTTYATNANLGPADDTVTIGGVPGFVLLANGRSQEDYGARILVYGAHELDMGRSNDDSWNTDFSLFALRYGDVEQGNTVAARVRTGPWLNLTDESNGLRVRPYYEGSYLNSGDETVYFGNFAGAEVVTPLTEDWLGFGDFSVGYLAYSTDREAEDRFGVRFQAGAAVQPLRGFIGRVSLISEYYDASEARNSSIEFGGRLSGQYSYDPMLDFISARWALSLFADARYRIYQSADSFIDPNRTRREFDARGGLSHLFAIDRNFGVQLDVEGFFRDANIQNFDLDNQSVTLSLQYRF
ncbi:MAG: tetratricopeptide repeat protein [Paracoccaceae bacterium]